MLNETEGMYTPAEERSELLVRKLWKHQLMAFWACVSRFPSLPGSTPSLFLSLCGFIHVMECLEMKSYNTLQDVSPRNQEKVLFRIFKLYKVKDAHCNCTSHTSMHASEDITHPHFYEPNEPASPVGRWGRPRPAVPLDEQQIISQT